MVIKQVFGTPLSLRSGKWLKPSRHSLMYLFMQVLLVWLVYCFISMRILYDFWLWFFMCSVSVKLQASAKFLIKPPKMSTKLNLSLYNQPCIGLASVKIIPKSKSKSSLSIRILIRILRHISLWGNCSVFYIHELVHSTHLVFSKLEETREPWGSTCKNRENIWNSAQTGLWGSEETVPASPLCHHSFTIVGVGLYTYSCSMIDL